MQQCNNATIRFLSVFLLLTALTFCSKKPMDAAQDPTPTPPEAVAPQDPIAQGNAYLDKLAVEISKVSDPVFFQTISDKAMEQKDGDSDFIYHLDKADPAIAAQFKAIEQAVGKDNLNKLPLLNIYVYAPYGQETADKAPQVYYWPLGKNDAEVAELLGYRNGLKTTINAKAEPPKDGGAIFVIGTNERVSYEEKQAGRSSILLEDGQKLLGSSDKYNFFLPSDYTQDNGVARSRGEALYRVVYSRFASMRALRDFEAWALGKPEVRFYCIKSDKPLAQRNYNVRSIELTTGYIDNGYIRRGGWFGMESFSRDNDTPTAPFIPFKSSRETFVTIRVVEEDRLYSWVQDVVHFLAKKDFLVNTGITAFSTAGLSAFKALLTGVFVFPSPYIILAVSVLKTFARDIFDQLLRDSNSGVLDDYIGEAEITGEGDYYLADERFRFRVGR